jgi:hypothetical protein
LIPLALALLLVAGCGSDSETNPTDDNPSPTSTTYTGVVTTATTAGGSLSVTVDTASPSPPASGAAALATVNATGVYTPSGEAAVNLSGSYDTDSDVLGLTGGGWTFGGGLTTFGMEGFCTGPGGASGSFSLFTGTTGVITIVGTFNGSSSGAFNFAISGGAVHGNAFENGDPTPIPLDGSFTSGTGAISILVPGLTAGPPYLATGTYTASTNPPSASGNWDNQSGDSGSWTGIQQ